MIINSLMVSKNRSRSQLYHPQDWLRAVLQQTRQRWRALVTLSVVTQTLFKYLHPFLLNYHIMFTFFQIRRNFIAPLLALYWAHIIVVYQTMTTQGRLKSKRLKFPCDICIQIALQHKQKGWASLNLQFLMRLNVQHKNTLPELSVYPMRLTCLKMHSSFKQNSL